MLGGRNSKPDGTGVTFYLRMHELLQKSGRKDSVILAESVNKDYSGHCLGLHCWPSENEELFVTSCFDHRLHLASTSIRLSIRQYF